MMSRTYYSSQPTFYVSLSGSDQTGNGSLSNPWATRKFAWNWLVNNADLQGLGAIIQLLDASGGTAFSSPVTYNDDGTFEGCPLGVTSFQDIVLRGCVSNPSNCVLKPTGSGRCVASQFNASFSVEGFFFDQSDSSADGVVSSTLEAKLGIGTNIFGPNSGYEIQPGIGSYMWVYAPYTINHIPAGSIDIPAISTFYGGNANEIGLSNPAGVEPGMYISAAGIPVNTQIVSLNNAVATLNNNATIQTGSEPAIVSPSPSVTSKGHIQMDRGSQLYYLPVGNGPCTVSLLNAPAYSTVFAQTDAATMGLDNVNFVGAPAADTLISAVTNGGEISPNSTIVFH